jgi:poly(3-hydroxybutyrate) depolymerase
MRRPALIPNKGEGMKAVVILLLLAALTMISLACAQESPGENDNGIVESSKQSENTKLEFSSLALDQTNRGTVNINGYVRHFSVTFPTSYDKNKAYPAVLFFHGCMCSPSHTEEHIKSYLDWDPRLESYKDDSITIKLSAYSEKKPEVPQEITEGGARGMWFWHKGLESERDDYAFVDTLLTLLLASTDINIDPENIFGVGHSSGAIFLISYVLGGPVDLTDVSINDTYSFKAISVTGGSTLRKGIVDFKENTPVTLPSVLHIQGERDEGLWFNGQETGKGGINFLEFANPSPATIIDGLRDQAHGLVYSAWDENTPSNPSTLGRWAEHLNLEYSGYEEYSQYYLYNFAPIKTSEKVLVGIRIKECGHSLNVDQIQSDFFRIFSQQNGNLLEYHSMVSRDTAMTLCR